MSPTNTVINIDGLLDPVDRAAFDQPAIERLHSLYRNHQGGVSGPVALGEDIALIHLKRLAVLVKHLVPEAITLELSQNYPEKSLQALSVRTPLRSINLRGLQCTLPYDQQDTIEDESMDIYTSDRAWQDYSSYNEAEDVYVVDLERALAISAKELSAPLSTTPPRDPDHPTQKKD